VRPSPLSGLKPRAPLANYEGPEMKYRFGRALEKKLGIKVFGPRGF